MASVARRVRPVRPTLADVQEPGLAMTTIARSRFRLPELSSRFLPVWRRNLLVWKKLAFASVLGNIADPLLYMVALGYGLGALVGEVGGMPYVAFIGTGMVCQSAMFTASFEGMYSAFSRMHVQRTWQGIINAPIALDDVVRRQVGGGHGARDARIGLHGSCDRRLAGSRARERADQGASLRLCAAAVKVSGTDARRPRQSRCPWQTVRRGSAGIVVNRSRAALRGWSR